MNDNFPKANAEFLDVTEKISDAVLSILGKMSVNPIIGEAVLLSIVGMSAATRKCKNLDKHIQFLQAFYNEALIVEGK